TEGVKRARQIGFFDIDKKVAHKYFVAGCLQNSRPTPDFCDDVPGFWNFKGKEWEQAQCEKVGLNPLGTACEIVYEEQIDFFSDPQLSPDGQWIAYTVSTIDTKEDKTNTHIWLVGYDGKNDRQITFSTDSENSPRWSADGKYLAFTSARPGKVKGSQVWLLDR